MVLEDDILTIVPKGYGLQWNSSSEDTAGSLLLMCVFQARLSACFDIAALLALTRQPVVAQAR